MISDSGAIKVRWTPLLVKVQNCTAAIEISVKLPQKPENKSSVDPSKPLLIIYSKDSTSYYKDTCSCIFSDILFLITRNLKQPRCPLADERIIKLWFIYTMEHYPVVEKNEIWKDGAGNNHSEEVT